MMMNQLKTTPVGNLVVEGDSVGFVGSRIRTNRTNMQEPDTLSNSCVPLFVSISQ